MKDKLSFMFVALLMIIAPAAGPNAQEDAPWSSVDEWLEQLGPMPPDERAAFDKAARSMYRKDCECLTFLHKNKVSGFKLPLSDFDRKLLIEGIRRGLIIPLKTQGSAF